MTSCAVTRENWDRMIAVNLTGVWLCMKYGLAQMLSQGGGGTIVNVASVAGLPPQSDYSGHTRAHVESGIGSVHNIFLIESTKRQSYEDHSSNHSNPLYAVDSSISP
ncbi:SDR family NAD(P)-dependent oxidoreductase [Nocardia sp. NPDC051570]|uniref:SDR family NAD(P)-dependent oxidoreductase n=1 Tax=Nocardia sp. NPDC051570 TaxID=3364324 RepID=UPI003799A0FB